MKGRKTKKRKKYNLKMHTNERKRSKKGEKENMNDEEVEGRKEGRKEGRRGRDYPLLCNTSSKSPVAFHLSEGEGQVRVR